MAQMNWMTIGLGNGLAPNRRLTIILSKPMMIHYPFDNRNTLHDFSGIWTFSFKKGIYKCGLQIMRLTWCQWYHPDWKCKRSSHGSITTNNRTSTEQCTIEPSCMMTSSNGNIFRVIGLLCGDIPGPRRILRTKASDAELWCFLWSAPE